MGIFSDTAPAYWAKGLPVIPLREREKMPIIDGWQFYAERMPTIAEQDHWLTAYPNSNIGIACGPQSDLVMIDIDTTDHAVIEMILTTLRASGESSWRRIGAKGMVLAYRQPAGGPLRTFQIKNADGSMIVEGLAKGRQCVLPPSIHPKTKNPYEANCELLAVYDDLPRISSQIEGILRQALMDHGLELSHSGWTRITDHISVGSRDNQMTRVAGFWAQGVTRGEVTFLEAVGRMQTWFESCTEKIAGDSINIDGGVSNLIHFLVRDVTERGKPLPKGWDTGLDASTKEKYGIKFSHDDEEWTFEEIQEYLQREFEKHGARSSGWIATIEYVLARMSRSRCVTATMESVIFEYISKSGGSGGITKGILTKRLKELRQGEIQGADHTEIAQAVLRMENEFGEMRHYHGQFWRWTGSHWDMEDKDKILGTIADKFGSLAAAKRRSDHLGIMNVMGTLPDCHKELQEDSRSGINFANGYLTEDLRLLPHSPTYGCTYTLPYRYMPELGNQAIKWNGFLDRLWTGVEGPDPDIHEKKLALQEAMAATMFGVGTRYARAILLYGLTHTGKSQIIKIMQGLLPMTQVSAVSPNDWNDKFSPSTMSDKLMNICGELHEMTKIDGQIFKQITSGDTIHAQRKHENGFTFNPKCTHWFGSNHLPKTGDSSSAFNRRWLILTFTNQIKDDERILDIANDLIAAEREHIVSWAVEGIKRLGLARGFTLPSSHEAMIREVADQNCSVRYWLNNSIGVKSGPFADRRQETGTKISLLTSETKLYDAYSSFCVGVAGVRPVILKNFHLRLSDIAGEKGMRRRMLPTATGREELAWENIILVDGKASSTIGGTSGDH
jgi:putative DNA primase/helicase